VIPVIEDNADKPVLFKCEQDWSAWLARNHAKSSGIWLRIAKSKSNLKSVSYGEAVEAALCYGWIDGQKRAADASTFLQRFVSRGPRSIWSKINRAKAQALIKAGRMKPAGLQAIERAKDNGQWSAAYDSPSTAVVPSDFQAELKRNTKAKAFFAGLNSQNRYAILWRLQTARKPETRARRVDQFIRMLERGEKLHP
jgi:uncharacterized protein YdeI (YjbR/CyaY-like superfamily)